MSKGSRCLRFTLFYLDSYLNILLKFKCNKVIPPPKASEGGEVYGSQGLVVHLELSQDGLLAGRWQKVELAHQRGAKEKVPELLVYCLNGLT